MARPIFRFIFTLILSFLFAFLYATCIYATENTDLFSKANIVDMKSNYEETMLLQVSDEEYTGNGELESVYVSKEGWFALAFTEAAEHHINIFNQECQFVRHFYIQESGLLLVMFDESDNHIVLFPFRDRMLIKIDLSGNYLSAWSVNNDDASELIDQLSMRKDFRQEVNGNIYTLNIGIIFPKKGPEFYVTNRTGEELYRYTQGTTFSDESLKFNFNIYVCVGCVWFLIYLRKRKTK